MNQTKSLSGASCSHKEKERLRHQRQVKLLNEVMEHIPGSPPGSQTKVRKLRHLVLYAHYLKMVHSQICEEYGVPNDAQISASEKKSINKKTSTKVKEKTSAREKISEPVSQPAKEPSEQRKKPQRAHIVFLQAAKSVNQKDNKLQKPFSTANDVKGCDNYENSALVHKYEYKIPDAVLVNGKINNYVQLDHGAYFSGKDSNRMNVDIPVSPDECELLPESSLVNIYERLPKSFESNTSAEDLFYNEKENIPSFETTNCTVKYNTSNIEENSAYDLGRFALIGNGENLIACKLKANSFCDITQQHPDSYILRNLTSPNNANDNFEILKTGTPNQSGEYLLNSYDPYSFQSIPDMSNYPFLGASEKYTYQTPVYTGDYFVNSVPLEPPTYSWSSTEIVSDNICSDNTCSCSSTDKLHADLENLSDSTMSCTNFSDSSNSGIGKGNCSDSPAQSNQVNMEIDFVGESLPVSTSMRHEQVQNNANLTMLSSGNSYYENNPINNEISFIPVCNISQPYFGNVYTNSFNMDSTIILPSESVHSLPDKMFQSRYIGEPDSLYSPTYESFPLLQPKSELINSEYFSESTQESLKPSFFEDETSVPLAQYVKNY